MSSLHEKLVTFQKYDDLSCSDLCTETNEGLSFPCLSEAKPLNDLLIPYAIMTSAIYSNDIFHVKWGEVTTECQTQLASSVSTTDNGEAVSQCTEVIYEHAWLPAFSHCNQLIEGLQNETIQFGDVEDQFKHLEEGTIKMTIERLNQAITVSSNVSMKTLEAWVLKHSIEMFTVDDFIKGVAMHIDVTCTWIHKASKAIECWLSMQDLRNTATSILGVLKAMGVQVQRFPELRAYSEEVL